MSKNVKKKSYGKLIAICVLSILVIIGLAIIIFDPFLWRNTNNSNNVTINVDNRGPQVKEEETLVKELWQTNSAKSDDYVGTIKFDSGLIDLPFVQGDTNDTYYRTNWESMSYDEEGSIYMDSANTLSDQNIILIGHYVYASYDSSGTHMFTPLAKLIDESNYEANKTVKIYLENEVREYEIAYVYYCTLSTETDENGYEFQYVSDGLNFYIPNYTEDEFNDYINLVKQSSFYDTGVTINYSDKFLTLQTCVENHDEQREIVLLKEINRTSY